MRARLLAALPLLAACATAPVAPLRCPTPPPPLAAPVEPAGEPIAPLLARLPRGVAFAARVDVHALFETRPLRIAAPLLVWSREYALVRRACTEQPWETVRAVEFVAGDSHAAGALLGPVADADHRCAPEVLAVPTVAPFRVLQPDGSHALVIGNHEGLRARLAAARRGEDTASADEAFRAMPDGLPAPLFSLYARGSSLRAALQSIEDAARSSLAERGDGAAAWPDLATNEYRTEILGVRLEAALRASGDVVLRYTVLFPSAVTAQRYRDAALDDARTRLPAWIAGHIARQMRDNPDGPRAAEEVARELASFAEESVPAQLDDRAVVYTLTSAASSAMVVGALAAIAIPTFTEYVKRSKTAEAVGNVTTIAHALATHLNELPRPRRRIAAIAPTPAAPPDATRYVADRAPWETPAWRALGFFLDTTHYYRYRVDIDARCYAVRAEGDLDGDGTLAQFTQRVCPDAEGLFTLDGEVQRVNELE